MSTASLAERIRRRREAIEEWIASHARRLNLPPLSSVDLRDSGFKIAPIDTNLFPSGLNNLCNTFYQKAAKELKTYLHANAPRIRRVLIWPEAHTRNLYYLQNVRQLQGLLESAGLKVRVANAAHPSEEGPIEIRLPTGHGLVLEKVERSGLEIGTRDFTPDLIWLNNDLSQGVPPLLKGVKTPILPPLELGWWHRRKSDHLKHYARLAQELAGLIDEDPWSLVCETRLVSKVSLDDPDSRRNLAEAVGDVLDMTRAAYDQRHISERPFVYLKDNAGTYGMGSTFVSSPEEVHPMNRKNRKKLSSGKGGRHPTEFLIQEGIPTRDLYGEWPMEPVLTLVGIRCVGGFFRYNERKDRRGNLNAPGMSFSCLCFHRIDETHPPRQVIVRGKEDLFLASEVLARVAVLAAGYEMKEAGYSA